LFVLTIVHQRPRVLMSIAIPRKKTKNKKNKGIVLKKQLLFFKAIHTL